MWGLLEVVVHRPLWKIEKNEESSDVVQVGFGMSANLEQIRMFPQKGRTEQTAIEICDKTWLKRERIEYKRSLSTTEVTSQGRYSRTISSLHSLISDFRVYGDDEMMLTSTNYFVTGS
jgi:hypothetical protein